MPDEVDYSTLFDIAALPVPELQDPAWSPLPPPALANGHADIFAVIRANELRVHWDGELPRAHRQTVHRCRALHVRSSAHPRRRQPVSLPDWTFTGPQVRDAPGGAFDDALAVSGADKEGDRKPTDRAPGAHCGQDEPARGP